MNTGWDVEYSTQYMKEVDLFTQHGIRYVYVKTYNNVRTYKYKKSEQLFKLLAEFYSNKLNQ